MKIKKVLLILLTISLSLPFNPIIAQEEDYPLSTKETYRASLFMIGDALLHDAIYDRGLTSEGTYDYHYMVENLKETALGYDLKYYNQETILGGTELGLSTYPQFNSPKEWGIAMIDAGFNLVSTANNHTMDKYRAGIENSYNFWKSYPNVVMDGSNMSFDEQNAIPIHEVNGITYAFFSYAHDNNGIPLPYGEEYLCNLYPGHEEEMFERIRKAKELADIVIVAIHWGTEYYPYADDEQRSLAPKLAEAGADIIIGNHPHIIEPIEWIGDAICYYAFGNMISAQPWPSGLTGMMGAVDIIKTVENGVTTVKVENARADLIYTDYIYYKPKTIIYRYDQLDNSIYSFGDYQSYYQEAIQTINYYDETIKIGDILGQREKKLHHTINDIWDETFYRLNQQEYLY